MIASILLLVALVLSYGCSELHSQSSDEIYRKALENPDLYEGDIVLKDKDRFAVSDTSNLWPNGVIPYEISRSLQKLRPRIMKAMRHIEANTCIRFKPRKTERNYVYIFRGRGCFSMIGRVFNKQSLSLDYGCEPFGTIIHELMHAIGFYHQHSRNDRDDYLNIHWRNINPLFYRQFQRLGRSAKIFTTFDFDSIMLYGERVFGRYRNAITMTSKVPGMRLKDTWYKNSLSKNDILSIKKLYKCP